MALSKQGRWVYCYECGSRGEKNGVCKICGHRDVPLLAGMVPNVIGLTESVAASLITGPECQLTLGTVASENSETIPVNNVISSDPVAETQLAIGSPVNLVVSLGPGG